MINISAFIQIGVSLDIIANKQEIMTGLWLKMLCLNGTLNVRRESPFSAPKNFNTLRKRRTKI